jgi:hypothetical protein
LLVTDAWCDGVLNICARTEDKSDDKKDGFYEQLDFDQFSKNKKTLLGDFSAKVWRENMFKSAIGNESLHEISNDNGVRVVNFATSKNGIVKSTMFPHCNIHKYTLTSEGGEMHNKICHILREYKNFNEREVEML